MLLIWFWRQTNYSRVPLINLFSYHKYLLTVLPARWHRYFILSLLFQGGAGGNGGNGKIGGSNLDQIPNSPSNAQEVVGGGTQTRHTHDCSDHCGGHCNACDDYWYHTLTIEIPTAACGGNGGNGGDGGNGGAAGSLTLSGTIGQHLTANNMQLESSGGAAGEEKLKIIYSFKSHKSCYDNSKLQELELQEHLEPVFIGHSTDGGDIGSPLDVMALLA